MSNLSCPECCSRGIWLPEPVYLDLYNWNLIGKDCDNKIKLNVEKERVRCDRDIGILKRDLDRCIEDTNPGILSILMHIGVSSVIGIAVGSSTGAVLSTIPGVDVDAYHGALVGAVVGLTSSVVSVILYEYLR